MASPTIFLPLLFLICSTFMASKPHSIDSINDGFTISLVHRDSPQSPFYNHSMNPYERRLASVQRSISHLKLHTLRARASSQSNPPNISSKLFVDDLEYIASYYIGTPPTQVNAIVDTGSEVIWTKAQPIFNSSASSSYTNLSCDSETCTLLGPLTNCTKGSAQPCTFVVTYADGSGSSGVFSRDKFSFDAPDGTRLVDVGYLQFGYNNVSPIFQGKQNGILGLNRGKFSLITQLGIKRFSHCFVSKDDEGSGSRIYFGSNAVISPNLTPLLESNIPFYYVNLEGISIGDNKVPIPQGAFNITEQGGGVIVDCGTSNTMLIGAGYEPFVTIMSQFVHKPLRKGPTNELGLCFEGTYDDLANIPYVTFHFTGLDFQLMKEDTFMEFREGLWCLTILRSNSVMSIIGNIQMRNLWVGYDLERKGISFSHIDCTTTL